jgi:UDP-N-acetylglucosamine--N-acetylmuramyl-(pentapeptide) pyrophosphoryl-undecaprenol N-acetylglucosamine transferase
MRLLVSGGGTGGHVYPILAVLKQLDSQHALSSEICYVGNVTGIEARLANRARLPFRGITTASFQGAAPWVLPLRVGQLARGIAQSLNVIDQFRPQAVLATGGYVCAPPVLAAWLRRVPSILYLPDLAPGMAVRFLARFTKAVAVTFPESSDHFPCGRAVLTGYPVRRELLEADKTLARRALGLHEGEKTLLVLGGSQGAHSINVAIDAILEDLLELCQIVHVCGETDADWLASRRDGLPGAMVERYKVFPYLHEQMIPALAAADLAVARAGAATTGEFPALGLPSVLIPYPYAGRHQELNARYMVQNRAAVRVADENLASGALLGVVTELLTDDEKRARLAQGARSLARPDAAARIAQLVIDAALPN